MITPCNCARGTLGSRYGLRESRAPGHSDGRAGPGVTSAAAARGMRASIRTPTPLSGPDRKRMKHEPLGAQHCAYVCQPGRCQRRRRAELGRPCLTLRAPVQHVGHRLGSVHRCSCHKLVHEGGWSDGPAGRPCADGSWGAEHRQDSQGVGRLDDVGFGPGYFRRCRVRELAQRIQPRCAADC